jgi:hypothetical protein
MNLTLKPLKKEERPFKKGPFFFIGISLLSFVIFGLLNLVVVSAMDFFSLDNRIQFIFEKRKYFKGRENRKNLSSAKTRGHGPCAMADCVAKGIWRQAEFSS